MASDSLSYTLGIERRRELYAERGAETERIGPHIYRVPTGSDTYTTHLHLDYGSCPDYPTRRERYGREIEACPYLKNASQERG